MLRTGGVMSETIVFPGCTCCGGSSSSSSSSGSGCCRCCMFVEGGSVITSACGGLTIPSGLYWIYPSNQFSNPACQIYDTIPGLTSTQDGRLRYHLAYNG